jgi:hypothetical protein
VLEVSVAPDDWAKRMIKDAKLDIISAGKLIESFPFEIPADFDVASLEPLDYAGSVLENITKPIFAGGVVSGMTRPKL